jgi:hypothetical protein
MSEKDFKQKLENIFNKYGLDPNGKNDEQFDQVKQSPAPIDELSQFTELKKGALTFGEKACGISFNPGGNPEVEVIKRYFANAVNDLDARRNRTDNSEKKRMYSIAITELQTAQMWAVKAATWQY